MLEPDERLPVPEPPRTFIWHQPDTLGVILAIAKAEGLAPPTKITMRYSTWQRIYNESNKTLDPAAVEFEEGIPIILDDSIPLFPGYQIHREIW
jgi:hypothetical protein